MKALVVGCGFLGEALADRLHGSGWETAGWTGSAESAARLAAIKPYTVEAHDVSDGAAMLRAANTGANVVVQCVSAGRGGGAEAYQRVYLRGAENLRAAFPRARFVFVGSTSVYAQTDGAWVDETSLTQPDRATGKVLLETERLPLASGQAVVRLAGLYGPGRSVLLKKFLAGESTIEGDGGRWLNQIHRDDAVEAIAHLLSHGMPAGVFNVVDDTPLTQLALLRGLSERLGRPLPPAGPVDLNRKRGWTSKRVSNAKLRALGWRPRFPSFLDAVGSLLPTLDTVTQ